MAQKLLKNIFMVKKVACAILVALCVTAPGYGRSKGDLKQQLMGKWQRSGGGELKRPCEFQDQYEFSSDTTYAFYMACTHITETGILRINVDNKTITMLPSNVPLPYLFTVVSVSEKRLVIRFNNITYKYRKVM
jgi:hypothetical protein